MKLISTSVLIIFIGVCIVKAQVPVSISVKPGISLAKKQVDYSVTDYGDGDYITGFYNGVNLEFINHHHFSLLTETGFAFKTYDYLYVSPLFKARWELGKLIPYIFLGPRMDVLLTRDAIIEGSTYNPKQIVWGTISGLALEYWFFPFAVLGGFHYQFDFTDVFEQTAGPDPFTFKHSTFALFLGLKAYFGSSSKNERGYNYKMF
jgi:hypothetical protein